MAGKRSKYERWEMHTKFLLLNVKEMDYLEALDVDGENFETD
jgi:hypothetical protein